MYEEPAFKENLLLVVIDFILTLATYCIECRYILILIV